MFACESIQSVKHFRKTGFSFKNRALTWALVCQSPSNKSSRQMHHPAVSLSASRPAEKGLSLCVCGVFWGLSSSRYYSLLTRKSFLWATHNTNRDKAARKEDSPWKTHTESLSQSYARSHVRGTSQGNTRIHTHKNSRPPQKHGGLCLCLAA